MNEEMSISKPQNESVVVYQSKDGTLSLEVQIADETVWLTQQQMSVLFNVKENNITYHIQGIYKTHELEPLNSADGLPEFSRNTCSAVTRSISESRIWNVA